MLETANMFAWLSYRSERGDCGSRMRSRDFVRDPQCAVSSAIRRLASSLSYDAQKNSMRPVWANALGMLRSARAAGTRSVLWRCAHLSGARGAARAVLKLCWSEARAVGVAGGQPFLYQTLCLLRGSALSLGNDQ